MLTAPDSSFIPASPFARTERWFYDGVDLSSFALLATRSVGANAHPALRGEDPAYAGLEGRQPIPSLHDSRVLPFAIYVMPVNALGELIEATEAAQARANLDALQAVLIRGAREPRQLMQVMADGSARVTGAKVLTVQELTDERVRVVYGLVVDLLLPDPWFYGLTVAAGPTTVSASGQTFTITHPGNVPSDRITFSLLGAFTNPELRNLRNGATVKYTGAITSAQRLYLNARKREARVNGALALEAISHWSPPGDTAWMRLEPGENVIEVVASAVGGTLAYAFLPPYV